MCMADYSEVQHGFHLMNSFFLNPENNKSFIAALDNCHPEVSKDALLAFPHWWDRQRFETYITSISEPSLGAISPTEKFGVNLDLVRILCLVRNHFRFVLFSAQFFFCVALILRLVAGLIVRVVLPRFPPKAAIAVLIPSSFLCSLFCSIFSALRMFMRFLRADCTTEEKRAGRGAPGLPYACSD
jgi:hypothetical protein